jgi:DNA-binding transcriptional LysR family regulator
VVADLETAERLVTELQSVPRGKLRITAPVEFGAAFLGDFLARFLQQQSEVSVDVVLTDRLVDLVDEGFDLAVRVGPLLESTLIARKLGPLNRLLCASPAYLKRAGAPSRPSELEHHACIVFGASPGGRTWRFEGKGRATTITVPGRLTANNFNLIRDATVAGLGIAMLPAFLCASEIASGKLQRVLEGWTLADDNLYVVYPSTRHLSAKVRRFLDYLTEDLNPPPWVTTSHQKSG